MQVVTWGIGARVEILIEKWSQLIYMSISNDYLSMDIV
jgi:hypothetical protein